MLSSTDQDQPLSDSVRDHYARLAARYNRGANRACNRAYRDLLRRWLGEARRVLEIGAGCSDLLSAVDAPLMVACDFSVPMLEARGSDRAVFRVAGDAQRLPFSDASFDGVFCVNLLEHVPDPSHVLAEALRVLVPGGRCVAVTPDGDRERLLDLLQWLRLKLPEGPHRFLTYQALANMARGLFEVIEHRRFLAFPAGPEGLVRAVDKLSRTREGRGLFQHIVLAKKVADQKSVTPSP